MKTQLSSQPAVTVPASDRNNTVRDHRLHPLVQLLVQLQAVIGKLSSQQYAQQPVGVMPGNVGAHVRHCIDHVRALLDAASTGHLDYEKRDRGSDIETDLASALNALRDLIRRLSDCHAPAAQRPLTVSMILDCGGEPVRMQSTFEREIAYVFSHTVHHHAIIAAMVRMLGGQVPDGFGYAPSTIAYLSQTPRHSGSSTCAPSPSSR